MSISISILVDNTSLNPTLKHEHGFSCAVGLANGNLWLWDSGATSAFLDNAAIMGVNPVRATGMALSHGHWDHAGGIAPLLRYGFTAPIHAHPEYRRDRYDLEEGKAPRFIGIPELPAGTPTPDMRSLTDGQTLDHGLTAITDIVRTPGLFEAIDGFYRDPQGKEQDHVPDDACLVLDTASGMVLLLGCCHSGVANTLNHLRETRGIDRLHTVVGGTHLMDATQDAIRESANALEAFHVEHVYPAHCSGERGLKGLSELLPGRVHAAGSGLRLEF
ncbi:7,8-dihydropterin-6-yl-methyl-4-(beta-D-ribofuranosyl)aminobenzene 5'-phosphate synthase [Desulfobaculum xiamenense]|uniref:7, 8-dihydropterin-6-yl-methyl-4-(Beta-D-ribofuranosyl)aminobenzene 5'-phosphate synthase n=1 Tax=Desulfobaculum xiamenense TaxID=995050 RepID=A0A846QEF5_9BACT|nr:MBL fold metallo-hydrolase [Desulfobaculum xiamenense]NJB66748.1 7,8-dihydropterin-6-yl-methyl-4-(beta-D-ribofuranosyl)aminobenzene 5'-phosphate synthase [Desulfobaculum xiamenense]